MTVHLGIDLGTQSVRALAVDDAGAVLAAADRPLESTRSTGPDGRARHEQDPASWTTAAAGALAEVAARIDPARVAGIAVDATSGTVVRTAADGTPLGPGVMYDDARGAPHLDRVLDVGAGLWRRVGHVPGASWALPTLLALPLRPGERVAHQGDVVGGWLVGELVATDANSALKTGYDTVGGRWPDDVLGALGLDPAALPAVVAPGTPLGVLGSAASAATGLPAGVPVLAGTTDGCAAQIGAGAVAPGTWNAVLGTTLVLKGVTVDPLHDPDGAVYSHRAPDGHWWPGGASSTGAGVLADLLTGDPAALAAVADPPVAYPLAGRGERFPFTAGDAAGFWLPPDGDARGLDTLVGAVGEAGALAAVGQGIAFLERYAFARLAGLGADVGGRRTISGGAVRNAAWNRVRADVGGVPLGVPAVTEPAFGTAVLAAAGTSGSDLATVVDRMVRLDHTVEPSGDAAVTDRLEAGYAAFVAALSARGWTG